jgi:hypothetical protein
MELGDDRTAEAPQTMSEPRQTVTRRQLFGLGVGGAAAAALAAETALRPTTAGDGASLFIGGGSELESGVVEAIEDSTVLVRLHSGQTVHVNLADDDVTCVTAPERSHEIGDRVFVELRGYGQAIGITPRFEHAEGPIRGIRGQAIKVMDAWYLVPPDFQTNTTWEGRFGPIDRGELHAGKNVALRALYEPSEGQHVVRYLYSLPG